MPNALITGASHGLGRALATDLAARGWTLVLDARGADDLTDAVRTLQRTAPALRSERPPAAIVGLPGDVTDEQHRLALVAATRSVGGLDLLVNNASTLGPSPLPGLAALTLPSLRTVLETNVLAPLALFQLARHQLERRRGIAIAISSDAAVEPYPGWGGYGSSKTAQDQLWAVLAVEHPGLSLYSLDPGDMRTRMHQDAYPGEDISDRPEPATVVPALLHLIETRPPSGRYRASDLLAATAWSDPPAGDPRTAPGQGASTAAVSPVAS